MKLLLGDCLDKLKELDDNSVDSIVTDPPYGLSFMGKKWDYDVPSQAIWEECMRVLKPGGHLLSFAGSRTYHRMAVRIEDAGFEIRDQIMWIYGSGFPKSHNIGKAVDKIQGNEREVVGIKEHSKKDFKDNLYAQDPANANNNKIFGYGEEVLTKGNSDYEGWGTALKPAHEPIAMARKPIAEKTVADNVLEWGTGGINIDRCRVEFVSDADRAESTNKNQHADFGSTMGTNQIYGDYSMLEPQNYNPPGRFPANIIFDEEAGKLLDEQSGTSKSTGGRSGNKNGVGSNGIYGQYNGEVRDENPGFGDVGGASRFFYCPKTSKKDRDVDNIHPTVKPTDLMSYLIRLVTPKGGVVLDPFMGSGSTGKAAVREGMQFVGIERESEYFDIAEARIQNEIDSVGKPIVKVSKRKETKVEPVIENKFWQ